MKRFITLSLLLLLAIPATHSKEKIKTKKREQTTENTTQENKIETGGNFLDEVLSKMMAFYSLGVDEKLYLQLDKPYYSSGEQIWFKGYLRNAITHTAIERSNFIYVDLIDRDNLLVSRVKVRRDSTGFNGYINLDPQMSPGDYTIKAYTRWMMNHGDEFLFTRATKVISPIRATVKNEDEDRKKGSKVEAVPESETTPNLQFDLQFLPEGGALLAGNSQMIAFKALGEDGLSVEVSGSIYNSRDEKICDFASAHKGMGVITLYVSANENYYAKATSADGVECRVELPTVEQNGVSIMATKLGARLLFQSRSTDPTLLSGAHVIIHSHGRVVSTSEAKTTSASVISMDMLFEGVNILSLVDANGEVLSERLIFKRPDATPSVEIKSDKRDYSARDRVKLKLQMRNSSDQPSQGEFAISVTDDSAVALNSADENILSYLLLSSDLNGHIEDPGLYFEGDEVDMDYRLDLLMRTQGWRRYDISDILTGRVTKPALEYEGEAEISGSVKGFFGNEARNPIISVLCSDRNYFDSFELDASSKFKLVGIDIPDSTTYVIQARGRKGGNSLTLNIDPDNYFPTPQSTIFPRVKPREQYVPVAFVNQSQDKFFYEGGMNMINLEAVSVTATKFEEAGRTSAFSTRASSREELDMMGGADLPTLIQSYPSMAVSSEGVTYRGNTTMARFIVDDINMEYTDLTYLTANDIETIEFFDGAAAAIYSDSSGGVFVITLRDGASFESTVTLPNIAYVKKLGYQRAATHYQPNYSVASLKASLPPDYRTTIYWSGSIVPDEDGNVEVEFFAADKASTYIVTVEGVDNDGEIYRASSTLERR